MQNSSGVGSLTFFIDLIIIIYNSLKYDFIFASLMMTTTMMTLPLAVARAVTSSGTTPLWASKFDWIAATHKQKQFISLSIPFANYD